MAFEAEQLNAEEVAKWKKLFDAADTDKDGQVGTSEVKKILESSGFKPSDEQVKNFCAAADTDNSGKVSWDEFSKALVVIGIVIRILMYLCALFKEIDTDGSGSLSPDELRALVKKAGAEKEITPAQLDKAIKAADTDGDGKISLEEFCTYILSG